ISQKQLSSTLRSLQRHGFAFRVAFATIPPRVEYELTELGRDFARSVGPLGAFAMQNQSSIEAARRQFDAA
ncbi:MAG: transcriptional regulator, partial [Alphaproteobacteria bacterium]